MTETATLPTQQRLDYAISDADQHVYESAETIAEYLDPAFRHNFELIQVNGRTTLMLNERLYRLVPNPTYDPVARPGSMVDYFRGNNPQGRSLKEIGAEEGKHPAEVMLDISLQSDLKAEFLGPDKGSNADFMKELFDSPYTLPGVSDGGAHAKFFTGECAMFTGSFTLAALNACSAARNAASGPFWLTAPRPIIT